MGPKPQSGTDELKSLDRSTISHFGTQWTTYTDNSGYYGSVELLQDILGPLLTIEEIGGKRVIDVGSGTGRIVEMLLAAGAEHVVAVEPSSAIETLRSNLGQHQQSVDILHARGDEIPPDLQRDMVFSIGVLHHISDPNPTVKACHNALAKNGRMVIWLYGREGNGLYLAVFGTLRAVTKRLPHFLKVAISNVLNVFLGAYVYACRWIPLPMADYMRSVIAPLSYDKRQLVIYDQINPAYAKYYTRDEATRLLSENGFSDVKLHHRHSYSWTVVGTKA